METERTNMFLTVLTERDNYQPGGNTGRMMEELAAVDEAAAAVEAATAILEAHRAARDEAIRAAFRAGASVAGIGERAGLRRSRVQAILGHPFGKVGRPSQRD